MTQQQVHDNYKKIYGDPTKEVAKLIHQLTIRGLKEGYLSEFEFVYLNKKEPPYSNHLYSSKSTQKLRDTTRETHSLGLCFGP